MSEYAAAQPSRMRAVRRVCFIVLFLCLAGALAGMLLGGVWAAARNDDGAALQLSAATWTLHTPIGWSSAPVTVSATANDADGLDETTAAYRLSTDGGATWTGWLADAALVYTSSDLFTVRLTVTLPSLAESATLNQVQLRVQDFIAEVEVSPVYTLQVDNAFPSNPVSLAASPSTWTNQNNFTLTWSNPADVSGIARAYYKVSPPPPSGPADVNGSVTAPDVHSIGGVTVATPGAHTVYVWLQDGAGQNAYTRTAQTTLYLDTTAPAQPVGLAATPASWTGSNSFSVSWTNPAQTQAAIARAYYKLGAAPANAADYSGWRDGANIQQITGLTAPASGITPCYVWLEDAAGNTAYTTAAQVNLYLDNSAPGSPVSLAADPASWTAVNSFNLSWANPVQVQASIARAYWKFTTAPTSNGDYGGYREGANIQQFTNLSVPGNQATACYVWLQDAVGNTDYTTAVSVMLYYTGGAAPGAPIGLQVAPTAWTSTNAFDVSWTNPVVPAGIQAAWFKWGTPPTGPEDGTRQAGVNITQLADLPAPEQGQITLYVWLEDGAGAKDHTQRSSATARYDATAPVTTHSYNPPSPAGGWFSGTVTLSFVPTDAHSGVAVTYYRAHTGYLWKTGTSVVATEYTTYTYKSVDNAGNEEVAHDAVVRIDTVPPTTTLTLSSPLPPSGWYTGPVTVTLAAEDALSGWTDDTHYRLDGGVWQRGTAVRIAGDGTHSLQFYSRDVAGNTEAIKTSTPVKIDGTPPTVTAAPQTEAWLAPPVTIVLTGNDTLLAVDTSGLDRVEYRRMGEATWTQGAAILIDGTNGDGPYTYAYRAWDVAGNVSPIGSVTIKIDGTPPGQPTTLAATPTAWVKTDGQFGATWTNPTDLSGIAGAYYQLDRDPISGGTPTGFVALADVNSLSSVTVITDGAHSLYIWLVDQAGNHDPYMHAALAPAFRLDRAAPVCAVPAVQGPLGEDGLHYTATVTVTLSANDPLSGLGAFHYQIESNPVVDVPIVGAPATAQQPVPMFFEGSRKLLRYWATDAAGNTQSAVQTVSLRFDSLAPTAPVGLAAMPSGWVPTNSFTVTWENPADYSGIAAAYYKRGSAPTSNTDGTKYTLPAFGDKKIAGIALSQQGEALLYLWLKDLAGNADYSTAVSVPLRWDANAPTTQLQTTGTLRNGYYITALTLHFNRTDNASGVRETRYRINGGVEQVWSGSDLVLSQDGAYTVVYYSIDQAGNVESTHQEGPFKVDQNAPTVLLSVATDYVTASTVGVDWAGDDGAGGSGVAKYTVEVRIGGCGQWIPWLADTVTTQDTYREATTRNTFYYFRVKATDRAGFESVYSPARNNVVYREGLSNGTFSTCDTRSWFAEGELGTSVGRYAGHAAVQDCVTGTQSCMGLVGQEKAYTDRVPANGYGSLSQSIQLPLLNCDSGLVLSFWYRIRSWDTAWGLDVDDGKEKWFDPFWVYIRRGDNPAEVLASFLPDGNLTDRELWEPETLYDSCWRRYSIDLTQWAGQNIWIDFRVWNFVDDQLPTWVFIDDVKLLPVHGRVLVLPLLVKQGGAQQSAATPLVPEPALPAARPTEHGPSDQPKSRK